MEDQSYVVTIVLRDAALCARKGCGYIWVYNEYSRVRSD